jgi:hypothetical protein
LAHEVREFEAESVCYLLCKRLSIVNPSEQYLAGYLHEETPSISLDCVMKAAGLIEQMGRERGQATVGEGVVRAARPRRKKRTP